MMPAMRDAMRFAGGNDPQSPIQLIDSNGQTATYQLTFDRGSGRLKLNVPRMPNVAELKEIRNWSAKARCSSRNREKGV
jgi:hypothetical protein